LERIFIFLGKEIINFGRDYINFGGGLYKSWVIPLFRRDKKLYKKN